jgi:hypothetical protein
MILARKDKAAEELDMEIDGECGKCGLLSHRGDSIVE